MHSLLLTELLEAACVLTLILGTDNYRFSFFFFFLLLYKMLDILVVLAAEEASSGIQLKGHLVQHLISHIANQMSCLRNSLGDLNTATCCYFCHPTTSGRTSVE